jgi:hypothetical protein
MLDGAAQGRAADALAQARVIQFCATGNSLPGAGYATGCTTVSAGPLMVPCGRCAGTQRAARDRCAGARARGEMLPG